MDEENKQPIEDVNDKPLSIVEEARAIRDEIVSQKEELKAEREKLEKVRADELLSGTAGTTQQQENTEKEETASEYMDRVLRGQI